MNELIALIFYRSQQRFMPRTWRGYLTLVYFYQEDKNPNGCLNLSICLKYSPLHLTPLVLQVQSEAYLFQAEPSRFCLDRRIHLQIKFPQVQIIYWTSLRSILCCLLYRKCDCINYKKLIPILRQILFIVLTLHYLPVLIQLHKPQTPVRAFYKKISKRKQKCAASTPALFCHHVKFFS